MVPGDAARRLPALDRSRFLYSVDDQPVWSLSCFFVKAGHRRHGLSGLLIGAAMGQARAAGAAALEAYPWDTADRKSSTSIYTGRASIFAPLGFREIARRAPHRPIMRVDLTG